MYYCPRLQFPITQVNASLLETLIFQSHGHSRHLGTCDLLCQMSMESNTYLQVVTSSLWWMRVLVYCSTFNQLILAISNATNYTFTFYAPGSFIVKSLGITNASLTKTSVANNTAIVGSLAPGASTRYWYPFPDSSQYGARITESNSL